MASSFYRGDDNAGFVPFFFNEYGQRSGRLRRFSFRQRAARSHFFLLLASIVARIRGSSSFFLSGSFFPLLLMKGTPPLPPRRNSFCIGYFFLSLPIVVLGNAFRRRSPLPFCLGSFSFSSGCIFSPPRVEMADFFFPSPLPCAYKSPGPTFFPFF